MIGSVLRRPLQCQALAAGTGRDPAVEHWLTAIALERGRPIRYFWQRGFQGIYQETFAMDMSGSPIELMGLMAPCWIEGLGNQWTYMLPAGITVAKVGVSTTNFNASA